MFKSSFRLLIVLSSLSAMYPQLVAAQAASETQIIVKWQGSISFSAGSPEATAVIQAAAAGVSAEPVGGRVLATGGEVIKIKPNLVGEQLKSLVTTIRASGLAEYVEGDIGVAFVPPAPRFIHGSPAVSRNGNYTVLWENTALATSYRFERFYNGEWREAWPQFIGTSISFTNQASRRYQHRVSACNFEGCSAPIGFAPVEVRR